MEVSFYLIRHTEPLVEKGVCYGQSDLDITDSFLVEASVIRQCLPPIGRVFSSPLQRCRKLASHLFPDHSLSLQNELKEIHCGQWEMRPWDHLPPEELDPWMKDFVNVRIPGGESYLDLYGRVIPWFKSLPEESASTAIVTHGGVIRSLLCHITKTPLIDSFNAFTLHYGCVIRLTGRPGAFQVEIVSNIPSRIPPQSPLRRNQDRT